MIAPRGNAYLPHAPYATQCSALGGAWLTAAFEQEDGTRSPSRIPSFDAKKLSPRAGYKLKMQEREEADGQTIGNVAPGIPAWRKLISRPLAKYVNYDGQFM